MPTNKLGRWLEWILVPISFLLLPILALAAPSKPFETKIAALTNFLSNPPPIKEALFVLREYPDLFTPGTIKGNGFTVILRANPTYRASWQADAFMFSETNVDPAMVADGRKQREIDTSWACGFYSNNISSPNTCWYAKPKDQLTYYYGVVRPQTDGLWLPDLIYRKRNLFFGVIGMGIADLQPGTLKWSGMHFNATNTSGHKISGELTVIPHGGLPSTITYRVAGMLGRYVVELVYSHDSRNSALPSQFKRTYINGSVTGDTRVTEASVTILALEAAPSPRPIKAFQVDHIYANEVGRVYTLDRQGLHYVDELGGTRTVSPPFGLR